MKSSRIYHPRGWAESTKRMYRTQLKCYLDFCNQLCINSLPISAHDISLYIAYLALVKQFCFCTIQNYLIIVKHLHHSNGLNDPISESWHIYHLLQRVKRELGDAQATPELLLLIKKELNLYRHFELSAWCACLIGLFFFGLLRPGNFLVQNQSTRILRIDQVEVLDNGCFTNSLFDMIDVVCNVEKI